jgi:3-phenylpropionate/trans-cinnamate dioxygenase ferredoxin reductase component
VTRTFVIVGGGLAAGAAVQALRSEGFDGTVVVVGEEPHPPYERPPLSKEYLRGEGSRDALPLPPTDWYREHEVEVRSGVRATRLDLAERSVELEGGERLRYDALMLATGGRVRRMPGEPSERVRYLRTLEDADVLKGLLRPGGRLVVVGAGFIGSEVAASARTVGMEVTMLEMGRAPLLRALGEEMGLLYAEIHREHGVDLRTEEGVESIEESEGGVVVSTTEGDRIEGEAVVVGIGIVPATELAEEAGLPVDNGVLVDAACRTEVEGVVAAGDVANHDHPRFGRIRVEHYDNALKMGAHAAGTMLGDHAPFDDPHWFWSDQYEHNLQMAGFAMTWDEIVVRGSTEDRSFSAFYLQDRRLLATLGLNRPRDVRRSMRLIAEGARPDPDRLRDDEVDLRSLASEA